jgi:hypothetical protein
MTTTHSKSINASAQLDGASCLAQEWQDSEELLDGSHVVGASRGNIEGSGVGGAGIGTLLQVTQPIELSLWGCSQSVSAHGAGMNCHPVGWRRGLQTHVCARQPSFYGGTAVTDLQAQRMLTLAFFVHVAVS